jgi:intracellular sulfur oxidation DsrE/DsrF family protein
MLDDLLASSSHRRGFLGRVGAAVGLGLMARLPAELAAEPVQGPDPIDKTDKWLDTLKGKHRMLFDMPGPNDGVGLLHVRNWMNTWRDAYGLKDGELNAVGTLYGKTIPLGFSDDMWVKYKFGAALSINDAATKAPLARNMFAHPKPGDPLAFGMLDSAIEALQARGVLFILCNNALNFWVGRLVAGGAGKAEDIRADLLAHILPKIVVVPGMVVAINKAQERGVAYMYLG